MALTLKELKSKMVPASAKAGSDIDSQYLAPASYDKKVRKAFIDDENPHVVSQQDMDNTSDNFKAQDLVKKNTKAPLREGEGCVPVSSGNDIRVNEAYEDEALDLLEEITSLVETLEGNIGYFWQDVSTHLKQARDHLLRQPLGEETTFLEESFKQGSLKLRDGSSVRLTKEDVESLNAAIAGTSNRKKLVSEITETKKEFNNFLSFARRLDEDFDAALDELLNEATDDQLKYIADNDLSEADSWGVVKYSTISGAKIGKNIGAVAGMAYGGAAGAAVGTSIVAAKNAHKVGNLVKKWNKKKTIKEDCEKESVLGTAAPAMDSDKKKKNLQEISAKTLNSYIDGAMDDQKAAMLTRSSNQIKNNKKFGSTKEIRDFVNKRQKGIDKAEDALKRKEATNNLYKKLGLPKLVKEETLQEISHEAANRYFTKAAESIAKAKKDSYNSKSEKEAYSHLRTIRKRVKGMEAADRVMSKHESKYVKEDTLDESGGLGGHPANYRNPAENWRPKFNKIETPIKADEIAIVTNDKKNIDGPLATKVGDIVSVKFSRVEFFRMKVIEMLPNNKIKVQAFRR